MAEKDRSNFSSSPSAHRLPTISAIDALNNVTSAQHPAISTGLPTLDRILQGQRADLASQETGGLSRGSVTEIYGPPGAGKSTFGMHAAISTLRAGNTVVWIDTAHTIVGKRLASLLSDPGSSPADDQILSSSQSPSLEKMLSNFHHFTTPTLAHLLALLIHPSKNFPPPKTTLIVIDAISTLYLTAFPRPPDTYDSANNQTPAKKNLDTQWAASRKFTVMGDLIAKLGKMAAIQNIAFLLISQAANKVQNNQAGVLYPTIQMKNWESGINTRIVLYRDWLPPGEDGRRVKDVRFAAVVRFGGAAVEPMMGSSIVPFIIPRTPPYHFREVPFPARTTGTPVPVLPQEHENQQSSSSTHTPARTLPFLPPSSQQHKRKREEVADSDDEEGVGLGSDEEFGWEGGEDVEDEMLLLEEREEDPGLLPREDDREAA